MRALIARRRTGKQVAVIVELKARFDEENNIDWARRLEAVGVHVVYGLPGLKPHAKLSLVVRPGGGRGMRRYVHMGTGNYNPNTARVYTDYGLLTADPEIGADATDLFNYLTGLSRQRVYRKLIVAPVNLRAWSMEMIEREMAHARAGRPARIVAKMNALVDRHLHHPAQLARQPGGRARVDLLRARDLLPATGRAPGLSENIQVISVVGRFLENSRVFYFENGGDAEIFLSSADWMERNLEARVETAFPILDPRLKTRLQTELLNVMLLDNTRAHELGMDGVYRRRNSDVARLAGESAVDSQRYFLAAATVSHY